MSVFRLDPIDGTQDSHHWKASFLARTTVWVNAVSESDAREKVAFATPVATIKNHDHGTHQSPWEDDALVRCSVDHTKDVPEDFILTEDGKMLPIANR